MAITLPIGIRLAAGLLGTALDRLGKLPAELPTLGVTLAGRVVRTSLRVRQEIAELATRGDDLLAGIAGRPQEHPAWATFDEESESTPLRDANMHRPPAPGSNSQRPEGADADAPRPNRSQAERAATQATALAASAPPRPPSPNRPKTPGRSTAAGSASPDQATTGSATGRATTGRATTGRATTGRATTGRATTGRSAAGPKTGTTGTKAGPAPRTSTGTRSRSAGPVLKTDGAKSASVERDSPQRPGGDLDDDSLIRNEAARNRAARNGAARNGAARNGSATVGIGAGGLDGTEPSPVSTPIAGDHPFSISQLKERLQDFDIPSVRALLTQEEAGPNRAAYLTLLGNRLTTLQHENR